MSEGRTSTILHNSSQALVVGAGSVYLFGFVIVSLYDARFGIADFTLFRTKVVAVGCMFVFLLALPVLVTFRMFSIFGLTHPTISPSPAPISPHNRGFLVVDLALSLPIVCSTMIAIPLNYFFSTSVWSQLGQESILLVSTAYLTVAIWHRKKFDAYPILFVARSFLIDVLFFVLLFRSRDRGIFWATTWSSLICFITISAWHRMSSPEKIRSTEWERLCIIALPLIFGIYATQLYPRIKPHFGGGQPATIVLHLTKKLTPFDSESEAVSLLDETEHGFYVIRDKEPNRGIFVARNLVEDIEFVPSTPPSQNGAKKP
jgi:hypothetical protein